MYNIDPNLSRACANVAELYRNSEPAPGTVGVKRLFALILSTFAWGLPRLLRETRGYRLRGEKKFGGFLE